MELSEYRKKIDEIDAELLALFTKRMDVAAEIAEYKQEKRLPVLDLKREKQKLHEIEEQSREEWSDYSFTLFSRSQQTEPQSAPG